MSEKGCVPSQTDRVTFETPMSDQTRRCRCRAILPTLLTPILLGILAFLAFPASAAEPKSTPKRTEVGTLITDDATILSREASDKPWKALKKNVAVSSGDLLVGLPPAVIESKNHSVKLALLTDLDDSSPYPILESAVVL